MTNLERWQLYNRDIFSPDIYIEWGFYGLIAGALQRRVYFGSAERPMFANQYITLVGPAGVGKGMVLDMIADTLRSHKLDSRVAKSDVQRAAERLKGIDPDADLYLFPLAADSTTYESLLEQIVAQTKIIDIPNSDRKYVHASLTFVLDELTSIFKLHADELITFLLTAWNGKNFDRKTKRSGNNLIVNPCLNMIAGTTPTEFAKLLRKEIVGGGFLGRVILVYAAANRRTDIIIPPPDFEQQQARRELDAWLRKLHGVYQVVDYAPDALDWLRAYAQSAKFRLNPHVLLDEFYVRKVSHIHRLAMCIHFSEAGYEMPMTLATAQAAAAAIERIEPHMHLAMTAGGRNELAQVSHGVATYLSRQGTATLRELLIEFSSQVKLDELLTILQTLEVQGLIQLDKSTNKYSTRKAT